MNNLMSKIAAHYSNFHYNFIIRKKIQRKLSNFLYPVFFLLAKSLNFSRDFFVLKLNDPWPKLYTIHQYKKNNYESVQIEGTRRKLSKIAQENSKIVTDKKEPKNSIKVVALDIRNSFPESRIVGICHGVRTGVENNYILSSLPVGSSVIGTDISPLVTKFDNCVVWDFHKSNPDWVDKFDFIYSNSIDQARDPILAISSWLDSLKPSYGLLYLDLGKHSGKWGTTVLDPFAIEPEFFPFFFYSQFGKLAIINEILFPDDKNHRNVVYKISRLSR